MQNKKHICKHCQRSYEFERAMKAHVQTHHAKEKLVCDACLDVLENRDKLEEHVKAKHECEGLFLCTQCTKVLKEISMPGHIRIKHEGKGKSHKCDKCNKKSFVRKDDFQNHLLKCGLEPTICETCNEKFDTPNGLQKHITRKHVNINQKQCDECEARFNSKKDLKQHQDYAHSTTNIFKCHTCEKSFKSEVNLKRHASAVHKPPKETNGLKCEPCEETFQSNELLETHKKYKHGNHKCKLCERTFISKTVVKRHMLVHHNTKEELKSFKCRYCPATFKSRKQVPLHAFTAHKCLCCNTWQKYAQYHMLEKAKEVFTNMKRKIDQDASEIESLKNKKAKLEDSVKEKAQKNDALKAKDANESIKNLELIKEIQRLKVENAQLKENNEKLEHTMEAFDTIDGGAMPTKAGTNYLKNQEQEEKKKKKKQISFPLVQENRCRFCYEYYQDQKALMAHLKKFHYCSNCKNNVKGHICGKY